MCKQVLEVDLVRRGGATPMDADEYVLSILYCIKMA